MDNQVDYREELSKEIYARFGGAYYFSECIHRGLCNLYSLLSFQSKSDITAPRLEEKLKQSYSMTLGQIAEKARPFLPEPLQVSLDKAIERRNYLAHRFWFEKCHMMCSLEGLEELRLELIDHIQMFQNLDNEIETYFGPKAEAYGITDELVQVCLEEVKLGKPFDPLPNKRYPKKQERIVQAWNIKTGNNKIIIIFESDDGTLWQLCDVGLGWSPYEKPEPNWEIDNKLQKYFPATINPRPPINEPWNYSFQLSSNIVFCVSREKDDSIFHCKIKKIK